MTVCKIQNQWCTLWSWCISFEMHAHKGINFWPYAKIKTSNANYDPDVICNLYFILSYFCIKVQIFDRIWKTKPVIQILTLVYFVTSSFLIRVQIFTFTNVKTKLVRQIMLMVLFLMLYFMLSSFHIRVKIFDRM